MNQLALLPLAFLGLETLTGVLATLAGFGVLIFVHELGHFLAAKWAGVRVEVFSLGMGPRIFGYVRGEGLTWGNLRVEAQHTDYRLSALPLGGYVKMLGQDDSDPVQEKTRDPDDFRNKPAHLRFIILIAGVTMNTIFAGIAFILAFGIGVDFGSPEVGAVVPGGAASQAKVVSATRAPVGPGILPGDRVVSIDGTEILAWEDIRGSIAISGGKVQVEVERPTSSGVPEHLVLEATPQRAPDDPYPQLGVEGALVVADLEESALVRSGGLEKGDVVLEAAAVGSASPVEAQGRMSHGKVEEVLRQNPERPVRLRVQRRRFDEEGRPLSEPPPALDVEVVPSALPVYSLGLEFDGRARIDDLVVDSPVKGVLEPGDLLVSLDGKPVLSATLLDAVRAAGEAHAVAGEDLSSPLPVGIERTASGKTERLEAAIRLKRAGETWLMGVKFATDTVASVAPGSPASEARDGKDGIEPGDRVTTLWTDRFLGLFWKGGHRASEPSIRDAEARLVEEQKDGKRWQLEWEKPDGKRHKATLAARKTDKKQGHPIAFTQRRIVVRRGALAACSLGVTRTIRTTEQLAQTIRALLAQRVSPRELGGPIQIASLTYTVASQSGLGKLLYLLAILSVNLAVLNVLPIPVLDGGHIFLLTIEKLKGRPLSDDVLRYVQYAGLIFVLGLMAYVCFNDIRRGFE